MNEGKGDGDFTRSDLEASISPMPLKLNPKANATSVDNRFVIDASSSDVHVLQSQNPLHNETGEYSQWEDAIRPDTLQQSQLQLKSIAKLEKVEEVKEEEQFQTNANATAELSTDNDAARHTGQVTVEPVARVEVSPIAE